MVKVINTLEVFIKKLDDEYLLHNPHHVYLIKPSQDIVDRMYRDILINARLQHSSIYQTRPSGKFMVQGTEWEVTLI